MNGLITGLVEKIYDGVQRFKYCWDTINRYSSKWIHSNSSTHKWCWKVEYLVKRQLLIHKHGWFVFFNSAIISQLLRWWNFWCYWIDMSVVEVWQISQKTTPNLCRTYFGDSQNPSHPIHEIFTFLANTRH